MLWGRSYIGLGTIINLFLLGYIVQFGTWVLDIIFGVGIVLTLPQQLVIMAAALRIMALPIVVMMLMVMVPVLMVVVLVLMVMLMAAALRVMTFSLVMMLMIVLMVMVMVIMVVLMLLLLYLGHGQQWAVCQRGQNLAAPQLIPRGSHHRCLRIVLTDNLHGLSQLLFRHILAAAQHNTISMGNLVHKELPIIPGIHFAFLGMDYGNAAVHNHIITQNGGNCLLYIRKLPHS